MIDTLMQHQELDNRLPGLLLQTAFYRCCKTTRVHFMVLVGINRTAWSTELLLTAVWASLVDCISFCHILKAHAQHCSLRPKGYFNSPSAPHPLPLLTPPTPTAHPTHPHCPPHPLPTRTSPIDSIYDIAEIEKTIPKTSSI